MRDIHISIVSHNQFYQVQNLLSDIGKEKYANRIYVTVTINVPEEISANYEDLPFPVKLINNSYVKGFAENHNSAFFNKDNSSKRKFFLVVNPDVRIIKNALTPLVCKLEENEKIGLTAPLVYGPNNILEDSIRELPTPSRITAKLFGKRGHWINEKGNQPDWIAGMFMVFRANAFREIGGFDEKYFLYYEDVDICSRLWLKGYYLQTENDSSIVHDAQRKSWRNIKYLRWHIASMLRFFNSEVYRNIKIFHQHRMK